MEPLNRVQLAEQYSDPEWRTSLLELLDLVSILRNCIIRRNYKPTEDLLNAIPLSEAGVAVRTQLVTKEKLDVREAKLLTLLGTVHLEPLIDIEGLDRDRLAAAISSEILAGSLLFPPIYGRELYDRATELFAEEREYLNHQDTLRLLEGMPIGVFQAGAFLFGPFGIRRRPFSRSYYPTTAVPIQHCADSACHRVHRVQLTTSIEAGINRNRPALGKVLRSISEEPSQWNGFVSDITENTDNPYAVSETATVVLLIGDGFSDDELRTLAGHASTSSKGAYHAAALELEIGHRDEDLATLNRHELLQSLYMLDDRALGDLIDSAVRDGLVKVPGDEIRLARVNSATRYGTWRLKSRVSRLGIGAVGADEALPLLRLSALTRTLFDPSSNEDMDELAWVLRGTAGATARQQLEEFLRNTDPGEIVDTLVLARQKNAVAVCAELGLPEGLSDDQLRDGVLWKLGFPLPRARDVRDEYWTNHESLEGLAKSASVDISATADGLRATASDYFVSLERFLFDSLVFATWALLNDHYGGPNPFVFVESRARSFAIKELNTTTVDADAPLTEDPVLSALVDGFIRLSERLSALRDNPDEHKRPEPSIPKFARKTDLQQFPFRHTFPFLDLQAESQLNLVEKLKLVGTELNDSGIMTARNGLLHAKQRIPTVGEVTEALRKARNALDVLEGIGCVRSSFAFASAQVNSWGRATTTMRSNRRSISFSSPSSYEWLGLPGLDRPHYLVQGAVFAPPNEMLRFYQGFDSEYERYWEGFPHRPEPGNGVLADQSETLATPAESGAFVSSRVG